MVTADYAYEQENAAEPWIDGWDDESRYEQPYEEVYPDREQLAL